MKKFPLFLFLLAAPFRLFADCGGGWLSAWPQTETIPVNPILLLEGSFEGQDVIRSLNVKHAVYLINGDEKIKLVVTETCTGQFRQDQAILRPVTPLKPGNTYELVVDKLPDGLTLRKFDYSTRQRVPYKWTVSAVTDNSPPGWDSLPAVLDKRYTAYGCGPLEYVDFRSSMAEANCLVKITLKNKTTGTSSSYYVQPFGHFISIGHDMCSGAFTFHGGELFEAEFLLVDGSGNKAVGKPPKVEFSKPTPADEKTD